MTNDNFHIFHLNNSYNALSKSFLFVQSSLMKKFIPILTICLLLFSCKKNGASSVIKPQFISDSQFQTEVLDTDQLVVVDFWASWCGPCKSMDPVLQNLATNNPDVKFVKIDTDKHHKIKDDFSIYGLPTLLYIKNGKEISRTVGLTTEGTVRNNINRWR